MPTTVFVVTESGVFIRVAGITRLRDGAIQDLSSGELSYNGSGLRYE